METFEWLVGWCSSSSGWLTSLSLELPLSAVSLVLQNFISLIQDQFISEEKGSQTGVLFPAGCFIFVTMSRPVVNLPNLLTSKVVSSLGVQRLQSEDDHSPPFSTEVKKMLSFSSSSSNTTMVWSGRPKSSQPSVRNIGLRYGKIKVHSRTDHKGPERE